MHAGAGIGGAGATGDEADAGAAGEFAMGIRRHRGAAFLTAGDEADFIIPPMQRIQNRQIAFSGDAEYQIGALGDKLVDQVIGGTDRGRNSHSDLGQKVGLVQSARERRGGKGECRRRRT